MAIISRKISSAKSSISFSSIGFCDEMILASPDSVDLSEIVNSSMSRRPGDCNNK